MDIENKQEPGINKKKNINIYVCVVYSRYFYTYIHWDINRKRIIITLG